MKCPNCSETDQMMWHGNIYCAQCRTFLYAPKEPEKYIKFFNQQKENEMQLNNMVYSAKAVELNDDNKIVDVIGTFDDIIAPDASKARDKAIILFADKISGLNFEVIVSPFA